jgi:hypothetical protein
MLKDLADHIDTQHALCVQWDGFIINPAAWTPQFLEFDYIGAVWPHFEDGHDVGNGGFSLRSKRLLELAKKIPYDGSAPEDVVIARVARGALEAKGIRFAPRKLAQRFAYERTSSTGTEFGFHGAFNLVELLEKDEVYRLLNSLEPQVLNENEHKELFRWAIRKRYPRIAAMLIARILRQRMREQ